MKWFSFTCEAQKKSAELLIYGVIDDWENNARDFAARLKAIPQDHEITVGINSRGGDVFAGYAIHGMLERRGVTTRCDGVCASMSSVIFQAGKKRVMPSNGMLLLHDPATPYTPGRGTADEHRETAEALDKVTQGLVSLYAKRSGQKTESIRDVMASEKFLTAQECKDLGLCDEISDAVEIKNSVDLGCFRNAPKEFGLKNKTEATPPTPTNKHQMKSLLVALAAVGLIPSADASEEVAVSTFQKNFAPFKAASEDLPKLQTKFDAMQKSAAESAIDTAIAEKRIVIPEGEAGKAVRGAWVSNYMANAETTKLTIAGMEPAKPAPVKKGSDPVPKQQDKTPENPTGETEETLRAELGEEKDATKRFEIARKLRAFRGHSDLFSAPKNN